MNTLAIMVTMTTYGTWLRGDPRGWVEDGIWTVGYDKRFCFDMASAQARVSYVEKHNTEQGLPARPWDFIDVISPR
jgi:hypothetical protein